MKIYVDFEQEGITALLGADYDSGEKGTHWNPPFGASVSNIQVYDTRGKVNVFLTSFLNGLMSWDEGLRISIEELFDKQIEKIKE